MARVGVYEEQAIDRTVLDSTLLFADGLGLIDKRKRSVGWMAFF